MSGGDIELCDGQIGVRFDESGDFDELVTTETASVHIEMMSAQCLWMAIYPRGHSDRRVVVTVSLGRGKLNVRAEQD